MFYVIDDAMRLTHFTITLMQETARLKQIYDAANTVIYLKSKHNLTDSTEKCCFFHCVAKFDNDP